MLTRTILKKFNNSNPPLIPLKRSCLVQEKYDNTIKLNQNNKIDFISKINIELLNKDYYLMKNDFPYELDEGICHMLCWYNNENSFKFIDEISKRYNIITWWKNHLNNRSIKEISHIHIFVDKLVKK